MNLKKFTKIAVVTVFIVAIVAALGLRAVIRKVADLITSGVEQVSSIIDVTGDGINFADYIEIDENGIKVGGQAISGGNIDYIDVTESGFSSVRYNFDSNINRALDISVENCDVVIATGDVDSIIVEVLESEEYKYNFSTVSNTLTVRDPKLESEKKAINVFGYELSFGSVEHQVSYTGLGMVICLPKDFDGEVDISTSNGEIKLGNLKLGEKILINTSNANVSLSNIEAYELSVKTTNGRITASDISATESEFSSSNERLYLENVTSKRIYAKTTNASIDFSQLFGEKFTFETSNGDIDGSILGSESLFSIDTVTDRMAYPESVENSRAQYKLTAKTSGGDINVRFTE